MVSFCCDDCQNVVRKARAEGHFDRCRTSSLSCIDCGATFTRKTIKSHTSCVTEVEKFEDRARLNAERAGLKCDEPSRDRFCSTCSLRLNGAVHAVQHYASKKHRAAVRKQSTAKKQNVVGRSVSSQNKKEVEEKAEEKKEKKAVQGTKESSKEAQEGKKKKYHGLKKAMKTILKKKGGRFKKSKLARALRKEIKVQPGDDLQSMVERRAAKSRSFRLKGKYVLLQK